MKQVWSDKERETWLAFLRTFSQTNQRLCTDMEHEHGITMPWYDVLVTLYHHAPTEGMSMQMLAGAIMMSTSGLTRLVDRMIEAGLIVRQRAQDRRVVHVYLTDTGRQKIESIFPAHQKRVQTYFLQHLSDEEMSIMHDAFIRIQAELNGSK